MPFLAQLTARRSRNNSSVNSTSRCHRSMDPEGGPTARGAAGIGACGSHRFGHAGVSSNHSFEGEVLAVGDERRPGMGTSG